MFNIVLVHPEIPQNTGNIGRTVCALGASLQLVGTCGFSFDEKAVRRAGLDPGLLDSRPHRRRYLPIRDRRVRSLNLSSCVSAVLYEAFRQHDFTGPEI